MKIKVHNLRSPSNNPIANQYEIRIGHNTYFQSYETIIAQYDKHGLILDSNALDYSKTTSRYLYQFTSKGRKELQAGIKDKTIRVRNLNK